MMGDGDIKAFQAIYKEEFGREISKEVAAEQGMQLLTLMSHIYKPMTQEEQNDVHQARTETLRSLSGV